MVYIILTIFAVSAFTNVYTQQADATSYTYDITGYVKNAITSAYIPNVKVSMYIFDFVLDGFVFIRSAYTSSLGKFTIGYNDNEVDGIVWLPFICVESTSWDWDWEEVESDIFKTKNKSLHNPIETYPDDGSETFYGYVKDTTTNQPIANAKVEVYLTTMSDAVGTKIRTVYTNSQGKYTFQFEHGQQWCINFYIKVSKSGYIGPRTFTNICPHDLLHTGGMFSTVKLRAYY